MAAGSAFGSSDDQLEDELRCAVCLEYFNIPVLLPCTHTFCKTCVSDILRTNAQPDRGVPRFFRCPTCRETVTLTSCRGIDTLPVNRNLDNLVRLIKSRSPATNNGLFPNHIWGKQKPCIETRRLCSQHDQPLALSCSTCKIILCSICTERHCARFPTHAVRILEELCHEQEASISSKLPSLKQSSVWLGERIQLLEDMKKEIDEHEKHVKTLVEAQVNILTASLKNQLKVMHLKIQEDFKILKADINMDHRRCCTGQASVQAFLKNIRNLRSHASGEVDSLFLHRCLDDLDLKLGELLAREGLRGLLESPVPMVTMPEWQLEQMETQKAIQNLHLSRKEPEGAPCLRLPPPTVTATPTSCGTTHLHLDPAVTAAFSKIELLPQQWPMLPSSISHSELHRQANSRAHTGSYASAFLMQEFGRPAAAAEQGAGPSSSSSLREPMIVDLPEDLCTRGATNQQNVRGESASRGISDQTSMEVEELNLSAEATTVSNMSRLEVGLNPQLLSTVSSRTESSGPALKMVRRKPPVSLCLSRTRPNGASREAGSSASASLVTATRSHSSSSSSSTVTSLPAATVSLFPVVPTQGASSLAPGVANQSIAPVEANQSLTSGAVVTSTITTSVDSRPGFSFSGAVVTTASPGNSANPFCFFTTSASIDTRVHFFTAQPSPASSDAEKPHQRERLRRNIRGGSSRRDASSNSALSSSSQQRQDQNGNVAREDPDFRPSAGTRLCTEANRGRSRLGEALADVLPPSQMPSTIPSAMSISSGTVSQEAADSSLALSDQAAACASFSEESQVAQQSAPKPSSSESFSFLAKKLFPESGVRKWSFNLPVSIRKWEEQNSSVQMSSLGSQGADSQLPAPAASDAPPWESHAVTSEGKADRSRGSHLSIPASKKCQSNVNQKVLDWLNGGQDPPVLAPAVLLPAETQEGCEGAEDLLATELLQTSETTEDLEYAGLAQKVLREDCCFHTYSGLAKAMPISKFVPSSTTMADGQVSTNSRSLPDLLRQRISRRTTSSGTKKACQAAPSQQERLHTDTAVTWLLSTKPSVGLQVSRPLTANGTTHGRRSLEGACRGPGNWLVASTGTAIGTCLEELLGAAGGDFSDSEMLFSNLRISESPVREARSELPPRSSAEIFLDSASTTSPAVSQQQQLQPEQPTSYASMFKNSSRPLIPILDSGLAVSTAEEKRIPPEEGQGAHNVLQRGGHRSAFYPVTKTKAKTPKDPDVN